ncbi:hypothetical protein L596_007103 [Steinernema carpocapsae]|uniref:Piwi domain-containing protein n=1 Tax=Steinernema carpocapsae TaxID=34508 RepID=A0A4U5P8B2_STECR|nr:hypothetical protein L596_007103 [Steinernema carpocapsae]
MQQPDEKKPMKPIPLRAMEGSESVQVGRLNVQVNGYTLRIAADTQRTVVHQHEITLFGVFSRDEGQKDVNLLNMGGGLKDYKKQGRRLIIYAVFDKIVEANPLIFPKNIYQCVYDGGNILFCKQQLVDYKLPMESVMESSKFCGSVRDFLGARCEKIKFKITYTGVVPLDTKELNGNSRSLVQFLDIVTSQQICRSEEQLVFKNRRYDSDSVRDVQASMAKIIKAGSEKTISIVGENSSHQEALLLIEPKRSPFFMGGNLKDIFDIVQREMGVGNPRLVSELTKLVKGLGVFTLHAKKLRQFQIKDLTKEPAGRQIITIERSGQATDLTVAQYFQDMYQMAVNPNLPCIACEAIIRGQKQVLLYPSEVLSVMPGQRVQTQKQTPKLVEELIRQAQFVPADLMQEVQKERLLFGLENSKYLAEFGIKLDGKPREAPAKVLPTPAICYGRDTTVQPDQEGRWMIRENQYFKPATQCKWALCVVENAMDSQVATRFKDSLVRAAAGHGLMIGEPSLHRFQKADPEDLTREFAYLKANKVQFVMGIFGGDRNCIERNLLKEMEIRFQLITQTIQSKTAFKGTTNKMVIDNILMKTNLKLGGLNHQVTTSRAYATRFLDAIFPKNRIFIGLDMQSPGSPMLGGINEFTTDPTIVGMCVSVKNAAQMRGHYWCQPATFKFIMGIEKALGSVLKMYQAQRENVNDDDFPTDIVVYRGGVSDGDIPMIVDEEIPQMKAAFANLKIRGRSYCPHLTVLLAQRASERLMPVSSPMDGGGGYNNPKSNGNVAPGTCVSSGIVSPTRSEFILAAHKAIKGTAKPMRYIVLDEYGSQSKRFTIQELENMTNQLCYTHGIVTSPVSRPGPLYGATDLVKRGRADWKAREYRSRNAAPVGPVDDQFLEGYNKQRLAWQLEYDGKFWA